MKRIKAYFAFSILLPPIDPLLSNRKMYYPFAFSISVSTFFPATEALYASSMLRLQNLGMKESIAVDPASVLPKTELGS